MKISALLLCILLIVAVALAHRQGGKFGGKSGNSKSPKWASHHRGKHHGHSKDHSKPHPEDDEHDNIASLKRMCTLQNDDKSMTYDLSALRGQSSSWTDDKGRLWLVSACGPVAQPMCDASAAVCIEPGHVNGGIAEGALWSLTPQKDQISITYGNGDECGEGQTRKTVFIIDCAQDGPLVPSITSIKSKDQCFSEVYAISSAACPAPTIGGDDDDDEEVHFERDHDSPFFLLFLLLTTCAVCCCCCACIKRRRRHNMMKKQKEMVEFSNVAFQQIPLEDPAAEPQYPGNGRLPYPVPMFFPPSGQLSPPQYFVYPQVQHPVAPMPVQVSSDEMLARQLQAKFDSEV